MLGQLLHISYQVTQLLPEIGEEYLLSRHCYLLLWCQTDDGHTDLEVSRCSYAMKHISGPEEQLDCNLKGNSSPNLYRTLSHVD